MNITTRQMSDAHEKHLAEVFGGEVHPGSGNQFNRPMDGSQDRHEVTVPFRWDGKSTFGKAIGVTKEMLVKAVDQARGHRPMISLRWYEDERLRRFTDWHLVREPDLVELMEHSAKYNEMRALVEHYEARDSESEMLLEILSCLRETIDS